jgi:hypothetical protein
MRGTGRRAGAAAVLFLAVGVLTARILPQLGGAGDCGARECSLADFRDAVYYPVVAFLGGENPYEKVFMERYPVAASIGIYSPLTLGVHLAFGFLPYDVAAPLYYALSVVLTIVLAVVALRICGVPPTATRVLGVGAFLLLSRPGHWNLFTGQVSLTMALATYLALWLPATHTWLAGLGLAITTLKPTYAGPLAVLMVARGDWRALGTGAAIALVLTGAVVVPLVADVGAEAFAASLVESFVRVDNPKSFVATYPYRVDVGGLARWLLGHAPSIGSSITLALSPLLLAGLGLRQLGHDAPGHAVGLGSLAVVTSIYHQQYDVVALTVPLVALVWATDDVWRQRPALRRTTLALVGLPFVNYLASGIVADSLGLAPSTLLALCVLNNVALLGALAVFAWLALAEAPRPAVALDRAGVPG